MTDKCTYINHKDDDATRNAVCSIFNPTMWGDTNSVVSRDAASVMKTARRHDNISVERDSSDSVTVTLNV